MIPYSLGDRGTENAREEFQGIPGARAHNRKSGAGTVLPGNSRAMIGKAANPNRANCFRCKFFYVTWDNRFPRGCRAMGFKS